MNPWRQALIDVDTAAQLIESGAWLSVAGDESVLAALPRGNWIGGTIPYFMGPEGGVTTRSQVFVSLLDAFEGYTPFVRIYDGNSLPTVCLDAPENGFSLLILPAFSEVHGQYAQEAPAYEDMFMKPIVGWVAGLHLDDMGSRQAKVFNGQTGRVYDDCAVVMHVPLPENVGADVAIVNLFEPDDGKVIRFEDDGFEVTTCVVDGVRLPLSAYLQASGHDTRLPLVADCSGALVNVSFKSVDHEQARVTLYGSVFKGVDYRLARPFSGRYEDAFARASADLPDAQFSCNCILNYLHCNLEGRQAGKSVGPMTFGEVAYQLLNQTMVNLTLSWR